MCSTVRTGYWIFRNIIVETCLRRSPASLRQAGTCVWSAAYWMQDIFDQNMPKVCVYLHDQGFGYPKAVILVVVFPLSALIDSHNQELKDHGISACSLDDDQWHLLTSILQKIPTRLIPFTLSVTSDLSLLGEFFSWRPFQIFFTSLLHFLLQCRLWSLCW